MSQISRFALLLVAGLNTIVFAVDSSVHGISNNNHGDDNSIIDMSSSSMTESNTFLRRNLQESDFDMEALGMGFALCIIVIILLFVVGCICCCCPGRFSLWDCVALACLWEICCDRNDAGGIVDEFQLCSDKC